jgi:hypothetical protein
MTRSRKQANYDALRSRSSRTQDLSLACYPRGDKNHAKLIYMRRNRIAAVCLIVLFVRTASPQSKALVTSKTLAASRLSAKEVRQIIKTVERSAFDTPDSWDKELTVRRVDLGSAPGLVVRGANILCGATGNCQMWVFRNANDEWISLLDDAPIAESFQLGPTITRGIKDFTIVANVSAEKSSRVIYKYDGRVYRAQ